MHFYTVKSTNRFMHTAGTYDTYTHHQIHTTTKMQVIVSLLAYPITHTPLVANKLPIKSLVARGWSTTDYTVLYCTVLTLMFQMLCSGRKAPLPQRGRGTDWTLSAGETTLAELRSPGQPGHESAELACSSPFCCGTPPGGHQMEYYWRSLREQRQDNKEKRYVAGMHMLRYTAHIPCRTYPWSRLSSMRTSLIGERWSGSVTTFTSPAMLFDSELQKSWRKIKGWNS